MPKGDAEGRIARGVASLAVKSSPYCAECGRQAVVIGNEITRSCRCHEIETTCYRCCRKRCQC